MKKDPRDPEAREKLAAWYEEHDFPEQAATTRRKASQCERFDPDFDYEPYLRGTGLLVEDYAGGEIICLHDGQGYEVYCDPTELQAWLLADGDKHLKDLPGEDWRPSQELLAKVWHLMGDEPITEYPLLGGHVKMVGGRRGVVRGYEGDFGWYADRGGA